MGILDSGLVAGIEDQLVVLTLQESCPLVDPGISTSTSSRVQVGSAGISS